MLSASHYFEFKVLIRGNNKSASLVLVNVEKMFINTHLFNVFSTTLTEIEINFFLEMSINDSFFCTNDGFG